jgi:hypothetical protein
MPRDPKPAPKKGMDPAVRGAVMVMGLIWTGIVLVNFALGDLLSAALWAGVGIATTLPIATASTADRGRRATVCRDAKTGEPL